MLKNVIFKPFSSSKGAYFAPFKYIFPQKINSGAGDATADAVTYAHKSVIAALYTPNETQLAWINKPTQKRHTRDN